MSDRSKAYLRGLFIPDPRATPTKYIDGIVGAALYPHASKLRAMAPSPSLGLTSSTDEHFAYGSQSAGYDYTYSRTVEVAKGGAPIPNGAGVKHKFVSAAGVAESRWYGWNPPLTITDWGWVGVPSNADNERWPHAAVVYRDASARILTACYEATDFDIRLYYKDYPDESWTLITNLTTNTVSPVSTIAQNGPCLIQLPTGRILLYAWVTADEHQIGMWYSDDDGATWTAAGDVLPASLDDTTYDARRIRGAYIGGNVVLFVEVLDNSGAQDRNRIIQYASTTLGATFTEVCRTDGYSAGGDLRSRATPDCVAIGGKLVLVYLKERVSASYADVVPYRVILGSAFDKMTSALEDVAVSDTNIQEWGLTAAGAFSQSATLALCKDDDDILWLVGEDRIDDAWYAHRSIDYGQTFLHVGSGTATAYGTAWYVPRDNSGPQDITAVCFHGLHIIQTQLPGAAGNFDTTLSEFILGGWSQASWPGLEGYPQSLDARGSWDTTWVAWDLPNTLAAAWGATPAGAPTIALGDSGLSYTGGAGDAVSYAQVVAITSTMARGITASVTGKTTTSSATGGHFVNIRLGDGANTYNVRAVVQSSTSTPYTVTVKVLDMNAAGATLDTLTGAPRHSSFEPAASGATRHAQVILHVDSGGWSAFLIWDGEILDTGTGASASAASALASQVQFGWLAGVTTVGLLKWAAYSQSTYQGSGWRTLVGVSSTYMVGKSLSGTPHIDHRIKLEAIGGTFQAGDSTSIRLIPDPDRRTLCPFYDPSPQSGITLSSLSAPLLMDFDAGGVNSHLVGPTWGVYVAGTAAYSVTVNTYNAAGANVGTYTQSTAIFTGGRYVRTGNVIVASATAFTQDTRWHPENSLAGCYALLVNGANTDQFKIIGNTPGTFSATSTTQSMRLMLEGAELAVYDGLDAADTLTILASNFLLLVNDNLAVSSMKVSLTSYLSSTVGASLVFPGRMAWFGKEYSAGEVWESAPQNATHEAWGGQRNVASKGKTRQAIQVAWTDAVDSRTVSTATPIPDYIAAYASGIPVASPADTAMQINGLLHALKGAGVPVVFVDNQPQAAAASTVTFIPDIGTTLGRILYGRIVTPVRLSSIVGLGGTDGYLQTVATVTIEEEL